MTALPKITFIYNRYKTATKTKPAVVEMRISYNYKQKYLSTGIMLLPHQWKNGIITNVPDALQLSQTLDKMLTEVRQVLYDMLNAGKVDLFAIPYAKFLDETMVDAIAKINPILIKKRCMFFHNLCLL